MSVTVTARIFWTEINTLTYTDKLGNTVKVSGAVCKLVLLAIGDSADDYGENSYQSFDTISKKASIEKRSVMRAIRALVANEFLILNGISRYGTNDYTISMKKLGHTPEKRAKVGRPKTSDFRADTSDSEAETSDLTAETSDPPSPDPSLIHPYPSIKEGIQDKTKLLASLQSAAQSTGWDIQAWRKVERDLEASEVGITRFDHTIEVSGLGIKAAFYQDRYAKTLQRGLAGVLNETVTLTFAE